MQQNALSLHRRAPSIVRSCLVPRVPWCAPRLARCIRHHIQRRCFSNSTPRAAFLGALEIPHLGGKHYFQVKIPEGPAKQDIDAWLLALDTCLPPHLQQDNAALNKKHNVGLITNQRDISLLLIEAQREASLDLLEHLGIIQRRWDAVSWVVQTVAQRGPPSDFWSHYMKTIPSTDRAPGLSLDQITSQRFYMHKQNTKAIGASLDRLTIESDPRFYDTRLQRGALGQIWKSLGSMTVRAAEGTTDKQILMPQVLSLLATLHHHGVVPESVYQEIPSQDFWSPQQPPLLHMLSSRILTALSDAAWDARQAAVKETESNGRGQYLSWNIGPESPGVRYQSSSQELRPEVWLELILWSCLHGGWVEEGAAILEQITPSINEDSDHWSLICWQKVIESSETRKTHQPTFGWRDAMDLLEGARPELQPRPSADDIASVVRTVSSEVIAAYVDASISKIHVGIGQRGMQIRRVLDHVKSWKVMLSKQNLGLGFATWDVIVQRFMESGGLWLERDPAFVMEILQLVEPYGREQEVVNATPSAIQEPASSSPYHINASALSLNLLHRVLSVQAQNGSLSGTMATLKALQDFTELNQRRSIEQFFRDLKKRPIVSAQQGLLFDTGLATAEYPAFYPQIPVHTLAQFLSVAKDVHDRDFYKWVFDSGSAVGPFISSSMYEEPGLAPALVRFASATDNQAVLENIMTHHSQLSRERNALIPTPILTSLVETLIQRRKWPSVTNVLGNINNEPDESGYNALDPRLMPTMIRELLRIEGEPRNQNSLVDAMQLFTDMVYTCLHMPRRLGGLYESDLLFCNIALLASVDESWSRFCSQLYVLPPRPIPLRIHTDAFNIVLEGVLETRGLAAARTYWETWCHTATYLHRSTVAEGGVFRVPRLRPSTVPKTGTDMRYRVLIDGTLIHDIDVAGRIRPNLHGARLLLRALKADRGHQDLEYDWDEMRGWLRKYFEALSYTKFVKESSLAKLADALDDELLV
jgi:hypothetical protein